MSKKLDETNNNGANVDLQKRAFIGKFGKYAVVGAGMATLMTPTASSASSYGCQSGSWSGKSGSWSGKSG